jgi:hypothetical protein
LLQPCGWRSFYEVLITPLDCPVSVSAAHVNLWSHQMPSCICSPPPWQTPQQVLGIASLFPCCAIRADTMQHSPLHPISNIFPSFASSFSSLLYEVVWPDATRDASVDWARGAPRVLIFWLLPIVLEPRFGMKSPSTVVHAQTSTPVSYENELVVLICVSRS